MRARPETFLIAAMGLFAVTGLVGMIAMEVDRPVEPRPIMIDPIAVDPVPVTGGSSNASQWFQGARPFCNGVEVETRLRQNPAPAGEDGTVREAACYALAGKIDLARAAIDRLPQGRRYLAAGFVFEMGHPAADAGDDLAAGPLMELVVEYWPNHYMALYHAGAAAFERDERALAADYLQRFLVEYSTNDGWRSNALEMLETISATEG